MGIERDLFLSPPDENLVCAICHDVFEHPSVLRCCGHTFCRDCLDRSRGREMNGDSCPTCRTPGAEQCIGNVALRSIIDNLRIKCRSTLQEQSSDDSDSDDSDRDDEHPASRSKRQKRSHDERETVTIDHDNDDDAPRGCNWTGTVQEWKSHAKNECPFFFITCDVEGCDFTCARKDMEAHMRRNALSHMDLKLNRFRDVMEEEFETKLEKRDQQIQKLQKQIEIKDKQLVHLYLTDFCRQWNRRKPDSLYDFVVYRPENSPINHLLCGIPGPKRTPWEGGLFPVLMRWIQIDKPPRCRLPPGFHHVNAYPSGTVSLSSLNEIEGWHPEMTIPEMLFDIQQFLAHPNPDSPAQSDAYNMFVRDRQAYDKVAQETAKKFSSDNNNNNFLELLSDEARSAGPWIIVGNESSPIEDYRRQFQKLQEIPHPEEPPVASAGITVGNFEGGRKVGEQECHCSCCSWGANYWDSRREMRFCFGLGG